MRYPFVKQLRNSKLYRIVSRSIKRALNLHSIFRSRDKYPELHKAIESYDLYKVLLDIDRSKLKCVAVAHDENSPNRFYSERFLSVLRDNDVAVRIVDLRKDSFFDDMEGCDALVFRPSPKPYRMDVLRDQLLCLNEHYGVPSFPSFREMMFYENKRLQCWHLNALGVLTIPTFVSSSFEDINSYLGRQVFPLVFKSNAGAGSSGVELVGTREKAIAHCKKIFSANGGPSPWQYQSIKDHVLIQEYVPNKGFDLRICVVGDKVFGYYRQSPKGDFRASGSGLLEFGPLPEKAIRIAVDLRDRLGFVFVAVDFIQDNHDRFLVVEFSPFIGHSTSGLYRDNGMPGWLRLRKMDLIPEMGLRCWFPDLMVKSFLESHFR